MGEQKNSDFREFVFESIDREIESKTDEKMMALSRTPFPVPIDRKKIHKQIEDTVINDLQQGISQESDIINNFFDELKMDDLNLYDSIFAVKQAKDLAAKDIDFHKFDEIKYNSEDIAKVREEANYWFQQKNWKKALLYFAFLTVDNPLEYSARIMRGMSEHNSDLYDDAVASYSVAISLMPTETLPYIQMIKCLILAKKFDQAKAALDIFTQSFDLNEFEHDAFVTSDLNIIKENLKVA